MTEKLPLPDDDEGFDKMFESSLASMTKVAQTDSLAERVKAAKLPADCIRPDSETSDLYLQCETAEKRAAIVHLLTGVDVKDEEA